MSPVSPTEKAVWLTLMAASGCGLVTVLPEFESLGLVHLWPMHAPRVPFLGLSARGWWCYAWRCVCHAAGRFDLVATPCLAIPAWLWCWLNTLRLLGAAVRGTGYGGRSKSLQPGRLETDRLAKLSCAGVTGRGGTLLGGGGSKVWPSPTPDRPLSEIFARACFGRGGIPLRLRQTWPAPKQGYPKQSGGTNGGTNRFSKTIALAFMRVPRHLSIDPSPPLPSGKESLFTFE